LYVTGLVETEKEDTDILTLRLDRFGKQIWADRYSSPEHDCDRAFSIAHDGNGGVFVAGETYVPNHYSDTEGWHLVLLHYDKFGHRLWVRRSSEITRNDGECVQVASDTRGGCFVSGTELNHGTQGILVLRYDSTGSIIWCKSLLEGSRTVFSRQVVDPSGDLVLCGTAHRSQSDGNANEAWLVAKLSLDGTTKWTNLEDGPTRKGANSAARIALDRGGNVIVAGVFNAAGDAPGTGLGNRLAVQKYSLDGTRLWRRVATESHPNVVLDGLSVNMLGDVIVGGTERRADGYWDIILKRYDASGGDAPPSRYSAPPGYASSMLRALSFGDNDQVTLFTEMSQNSGAEVRLRSLGAKTDCNASGFLLHQWLFEPTHNGINYIRDCTTAPYPAVTGQTGLLAGPRALMVVKY
jgi:hypothetical protein